MDSKLVLKDKLNIQVVDNPAEINEQAINLFYDNLKDVSFFQSWFYFKYKLSEGNGHKLIICSDGNNNIKGIVFGEIQKRNWGPLSIFTSRTILEGTPFVIDNDIEILDRLLTSFLDEFKTRSIYILIRNYFNTSELKKTFCKYGFIYEEHLNILVELTKSEEHLWQELNPKRRNEIRKAKREGVKFTVRDDMESLKNGYEILKSVYKRTGLPLLPFKVFDKLLNYSHGRNGLKIFCAEFDGKIIGVMFALCYSSVIYDWYAGSNPEYYCKNPNDLIPWEVFLWGKLNGFTTFDFGGAGKPNVPYGVRNYKLKFGGELVNHGRYLRINNKILYRLGTLGIKIYKWGKN